MSDNNPQQPPRPGRFDAAPGLGQQPAGQPAIGGGQPRPPMPPPRGSVAPKNPSQVPAQPQAQPPAQPALKQGASGGMKRGRQVDRELPRGQNAIMQLPQMPVARFPSWAKIRQDISDEIMDRVSRFNEDEAKYRTDIHQLQQLISELNARHTDTWRVSQADIPDLVRLVFDEIAGLGAVGRLLDEIEGLEDIECNRYDEFFLVVNGKTYRCEPSPFTTNKDVLEFLQKCARTKEGMEINVARPVLEMDLPDGSRLEGILDTLSPRGHSFTIRRASSRNFTMEQYLETGMFTREFLEKIIKPGVRSNCNIVVSGGTGSGKTSFLNAIGQFINTGRVITIEDVPELRLNVENLVPLQTYRSDASKRDKNQGIGTEKLIHVALRSRPDRLFIGEVRSSVAYDLLQALQTGHDGSMTTVHANSPIGAVTRLETLALGAEEAPNAATVRDMISESIDLVIQVARFHGEAFRKVQAAYQVFNITRLTEEGRARFEALREAEDQNLIHYGGEGSIWMLRLFEYKRHQGLIEYQEMLPIFGRGPSTLVQDG